MRRIQSAERGEELSAFQLEVKWQAGRLHECYFNFHFRFIVVIQLENNVGEAFEVRIDCAIKRQFGVARIETALLRIVVADLDVMEIARTGISECEQTIERNVHISFATAYGDRLR